MRAKREDEVWKVIKEVTKTREDRTWTLKEITEEVEIAEIFNNYFIKKIKDLKENIDKMQIKDSIQKLQEKVKAKNL